MKLCSICHKNPATIFTAKIDNGKPEIIGVCAECAQKMGLPPLNQLLQQSGINPEEMEGFTEQMNNIFEDMNIDDITNNEMFTNFFTAFNMGKQSNVPKDLEEENHENNTKSSNNDNDNKEKSNIKSRKNWFGRKRKYLDMYGTNLTNKARKNGVDKVVGREHEIERLIQILNRRTKNNPVLIGEPGVGKTAIAEGLAVRIVEKNVPSKLYDSEVYLLDLTSVVAGTQFRGQFEGRMKSIIEEAKKRGNVILVIDEIHNIIGAGEAQGGAINAANILKPALARGEIQVIGTTTLDEYRKYIEKDSALERRFQPIIVEEPTVDETIEILRGIKKYYEDYHKVKIPEDAIEAASNLSKRYISDRYLPDKAIDVIDEACSRININSKELIELEEFKKEMKKLEEEMQEAANNTDYETAAKYKAQWFKLKTQIDQLNKKCNEMKVTVEDVAYVIEQWTKVPVHKVKEGEAEKLLKLEEMLHNRVIGQNEAVVNLSKAIRRNRLGFRKKEKPSSFIFVGPTGVGKTELVKSLCCELFGSEEALIRVDMSEYMEKHTVSKLIGAPPGYVGYDEGGQLTEKVRRRPYSVILLDEIEKAHPDVFNILLQILEDGRLTDGQGRTVYFDNTVIIMTSNAGTNFKENRIGFGNENYDALENNAKDALKRIFRPEFLNRVDETIVFKTLSKEELYKIIDLMLNEVKDEISEKKIEMDVEEKVKEFILEKGYDSKYGARPLRRTIQKYIEDEITELYLEDKIKEGSHVDIKFKDNKLVFENE